MSDTTPEQRLPEPGATKKEARKLEVRKPPKGSSLRMVGLFLLETLLPVLAAGVLIGWLFANFNLWTMDRTGALVLFAGGLVAVSLMLTLLLDSVTAAPRKRQRKLGVTFANGPVSRLVKVVLGGILLPLAVFGAANFLLLPGRGTAMNELIAVSKRPVVAAPPDQVGTLAGEAKNPATRVLSIQVLQGLQSPDALNRLLRLAGEDDSTLTDPAVADALSKAIAAFGSQARDPLLVMFQGVDPAKAGGSTANADLYGRYFSGSFESLSAEIKASPTDPSAQEEQLAQLQAAQDQLEKSLREMEMDSLKAAEPAALRLDFVLRTFLAMNLKEEAQVLAFAKGVATDARYTSQVRGDALLLVAKLGGKDDMNGLYAYLNQGDELLQAKALQAIVALQNKLTGGQQSGSTTQSEGY